MPICMFEISCREKKRCEKERKKKYEFGGKFIVVNIVKTKGIYKWKDVSSALLNKNFPFFCFMFIFRFLLFFLFMIHKKKKCEKSRANIWDMLLKNCWKCVYENWEGNVNVIKKSCKS